MTRGGYSRIAQRLVTAAAMLGLGVAVVGGGIAFADDAAGSGAPLTPGAVTDYRVDTPTAPVVSVDPFGHGGVVSPDEWSWT